MKVEEVKHSGKAVGNLLGRLWKSRKYGTLDDKESEARDGHDDDVGSGVLEIHLTPCTEDTLGRHTRIHYESEEEYDTANDKINSNNTENTCKKQVRFNEEETDDDETNRNIAYHCDGKTGTPDNIPYSQMTQKPNKGKKKKKKKKFKKKVKKGTWKVMKKGWKYFKAGVIQVSHPLGAFSVTNIVNSNMQTYGKS